MEKNIVKPERSQMKIWRMRISRCVPKTTYIHSEYVISNAFPMQQWSHERALMLRHSSVAVLY